MPSHPFVGIGESGLQMTQPIQGLQPIERIQGMHSSQRRGGFLEQTLQLRHSGRILTFMDEARNRLAHPAIRAFESGHAVTDRGLTPTPRGRPPEALRNHPPNAATIVAAVEVQVLLDGLRDGPRVLDDLPVHVHDVKTTVRTVLEMHRAEPRVSRRQKLNPLLIHWPARHPAHAIGMQLLPVNQITPGIANENVVDEVRAIGVAPVHRCPGGSREIAGNPPTALDHAWDDTTDAPPGPNNAPGLVGTDPEDFGGRPVGRDAHPRRRQGDPGIARGMRPVHGHPLEVIAVAGDESIAHRIEGESILAASGLGTDRLGRGIEAEIQPAQIERRRLGTRTENPISPIGSRGSVKTVIQPPIEGIQESLNIEPSHPMAESGDHHTSLIGFAVAGGVVEPQNIGRRSDIQATPGTNLGRRPWQVVGEHRRTIEAPIAVEILQHPNPSGVRGFIPALGVIDHFRHEGAAVFIESHGHRTHHLGFAGNQFHAKPLPNLEGLRGSIR